MSSKVKSYVGKATVQTFEKDLQTAMEASAIAMTWKVKFSTHLAVLKDGSVRKYIHIDGGMPRDVDVILVEGEGHTIVPKTFCNDQKYKATEKRPLTTDEAAYNKRMDTWYERCGKEAKERLDIVLTTTKSWDVLWGYVALMERNSEIAKSDKYFGE